MFEGYRAVAERLGLALVPGDPGPFAQTLELVGGLDGHPVRVRHRLGTDVTLTEVGYGLWLDLGLDVKPRGRAPYGDAQNVRWLGRFYGRADLHDDGRGLEAAFDVHADEAPRARALLEALRAPLGAWHREARDFHLTDACVALRRRSHRPHADEGALLADLGACVALARHVEHARACQHPAAALAEHAGALADFARARGLAFSGVPLVVWGSLGARRFFARTTRTAPHAFDLDASLAFDASAPPRQPVVAPAAFDALARAGYAARVSTRGLHLHRALGAEPCELEDPVAVLERAAAALEASGRGGYR